MRSELEIKNAIAMVTRCIEIKERLGMDKNPAVKAAAAVLINALCWVLEDAGGNSVQETIEASTTAVFDLERYYEKIKNMPHKVAPSPNEESKAATIADMQRFYETYPR